MSPSDDTIDAFEDACVLMGFGPDEVIPYKLGEPLSPLAMEHLRVDRGVLVLPAWCAVREPWFADWFDPWSYDDDR